MIRRVKAFGMHFVNQRNLMFMVDIKIKTDYIPLKFTLLMMVGNLVDHIILRHVYIMISCTEVSVL